MKKLLSVLLIMVLVFSVANALAEDWTCMSCGNVTSGNFCNNCGAAKPSEDWTCPNCNSNVTGKFCNNCGTARPSSSSAPSVTEAPAATAAPIVTAAPVQVKDDPDEFKAILNYTLSPITEASVKNYISMGDNMFTISMTNGDSYMGLISDSDGAYAIEIMNYSSSDYSSVDSPYDCQSDEFIQVLNYLLRKKGTTVKAIIPMFGDIYSVQDSAGNSYMLTIMCAPSIVTIGMLGE